MWIHAVSVGEINVALRFMGVLRELDPGLAFVLTATTSTGHALAASRLHPDDVLLYFPCDFPFVVRRVLNCISPSALVLVESELWPNLIREATRRGIPVMLVNGRISDSSYRGYRLVSGLARPVLSSMALLLVQSEVDRRRLVSLGSVPQRTHVIGSAKYDVAVLHPREAAPARQVLAACGIAPDDLLIVGGSTWRGEERILLEIYNELRPDWPTLRLVLVPRHVERSSEVEAEIRRHGLPVVRRSQVDGIGFFKPSVPPVLLVDTTGELTDFYAAATVVFVGKSLTQHGGQNPIEPAALGKPVIVGPNMENFVGIITDFLAGEAVVQVRDAAGLKTALTKLLGSAEARRALGERAREVVESKRGALRRSAEMILEQVRLQHGSADFG